MKNTEKAYKNLGDVYMDLQQDMKRLVKSLIRKLVNLKPNYGACLSRVSLFYTVKSKITRLSTDLLNMLLEKAVRIIKKSTCDVVFMF